MANFKRLKVWRKAYALSLNVDRMLRGLINRLEKKKKKPDDKKERGENPDLSAGI